LYKETESSQITL